MSVEAASNNNNARREQDAFRDNPTPPANSSVPIGDGLPSDNSPDENAMLTSIFSHAFAGTAVSFSQSATTHELDDFDDFEASVLTSCLLSSVTSVAVPASFEQQVLERVKQGIPVSADTPKPLPSAIRLNPSRAFFRRYRRVLQVALPLILVGSVALAMYMRSTSSSSEEAPSNNQSTPAIVHPEPPAMDIHMPANKEFMRFEQEKKKKPRRSTIKVYRGF